MPHPSHVTAIDLAALARSDPPDGLLAGFQPLELAKGQLLSTPNSALDQVFVVRSGRLRVYLAGENRELSLSYLEAGDIYTTHTPTYVEAVAPTLLWVMDTPVFARKLATDPSATPAMMRVLGQLLANAVALIEDLALPGSAGPSRPLPAGARRAARPAPGQRLAGPDRIGHGRHRQSARHHPANGVFLAQSMGTGGARPSPGPPQPADPFSRRSGRTLPAYGLGCVHTEFTP